MWRRFADGLILPVLPSPNRTEGVSGRLFRATRLSAIRRHPAGQLLLGRRIRRSVEDREVKKGDKVVWSSRGSDDTLHEVIRKVARDFVAGAAAEGVGRGPGRRGREQQGRRRGHVTPPPDWPGVRHAWLPLSTGVRLHIAEAGPERGEPVVALHGWPQHWWMWRRLMTAMAADGRRVICPDLRGLGWSSFPIDRDFSKQRLVEDVCALLDVLGVRASAVVGHDWGGWIGFLLAAQQPQRVRRLVACSIVAPWQSRKAPPTLGDARFAYQALLATPWVGPSIAGRRGAVAALMRGATGPVFRWPADDVASYVDVNCAPEKALASSLLYRQFLLREAGGGTHVQSGSVGLRMPVLQLVGTEDLVGSRLPLSVPPGDWSLERVAECGHFLLDERPEFAVGRIRAFLAAR